MGRNQSEVDATPAAPLGTRFWRMWSADGLSNLADGILKISLPLAALAYTRSPALIAGLAFAITLPWLLFALPAGALVDRVDRRNAMLAANMIRAGGLALLVLATAAGGGSIWGLYAVALCVGTAETVYDTAAQSILPQLVPRDRLTTANSRLFAVELATHESIGPPLAGLLVASGVTLALVTPLGLWAIALAALFAVRGRFRAAAPTAAVAPTDEPAAEPTPPHASLRADIAEGLRFVWRNRLLRALAAMTGGFNFATNATFAVFVLYATGPGSAMHLSKQAYGVLLTLTAAGSILGSVIAERIIHRFGRGACIAASIPCGALLVGAPAMTTSPYIIGAVLFVGGVTNMLWNVIAVSLRQRLTPDRLLGRVNSAYRLLAWGSMPLGAAAGGLLAQTLGVRAVFIAAAAVMVTLLTGLRAVTNRRMAEAEQAAQAQAEAQAEHAAEHAAEKATCPASPSPTAA